MSLELALLLQEAGVKTLGTSPDSIDPAEDLQRFSALRSSVNITQPANGRRLLCAGKRVTWPPRSSAPQPADRETVAEADSPAIVAT